MTDDSNHAPMRAAETTGHAPMAAHCEHHYATRILGGHPLAVRACTLCRKPDWGDLMEQADELYRWGWTEGRAGKAPREALSAYDKPREASDGELAGRNGDRSPQTASSDALREDVAAAIRERIKWATVSPTQPYDTVTSILVPTERDLADVAIAALLQHLDVGEEEAWCKICRRVWDGPRHQCESAAERKLATLRDAVVNLASRGIDAMSAAWVRSLIDGPAATEATQEQP